MTQIHPDALRDFQVELRHCEKACHVCTKECQKCIEACREILKLVENDPHHHYAITVCIAQCEECIKICQQCEDRCKELTEAIHDSEILRRLERILQACREQCVATAKAVAICYGHCMLAYEKDPSERFHETAKVCKHCEHIVEECKKSCTVMSGHIKRYFDKKG